MRDCSTMTTARRFGCIATLAVILAILPMPPASAQDTGAGFAQHLSQTIPDRMARDGVPGLVIALLRGGAPVWTGAFGMADPASGRAMTEDALFRVESISKPVTAWAVMRLATTRRLDLDAPVTACLQRWQPPTGTPPMTPRQLLSHTAGVGLGDFTDRHAPGATRPGLPNHLARDFKMIGPPGTQFAYSDTGYNLLELVIEDCTGEDFSTLATREVLTPLGMLSASFDWTGTDMPVGHDLRGRPVPPYVYPGRGSGGLHATAADIARFAAASMQGADHKALTADAVARLHRPVVDVGGLFGFAAEGYALGHFTETLSDGRQAVWHGGQGFGWMSHLHMVPQTGDGIVILANSQRAWPLMAETLAAWSGELGVRPVGMSRIHWAEPAAWVAIAVVGLGAALALLAAIRGGPRRRIVRAATGAVAAALLILTLWMVSSNYLFLFSILPGLWPWLATATGVFGLCLGAFALRSKGRQ